MTDPTTIRERFREEVRAQLTAISGVELNDHWLNEIIGAHDTLINSVIEVMEAGKVDGKFPWQSLLFGDCPECGLEVNREWMDATCKRIADAATDQHIKLLQSIQGK